MLMLASRIVSEKSTVSEVVVLSSITIESGTWKKLAPPSAVNASSRCTTFGGPVGIFVTATCFEPAAVQLATGEGSPESLARDEHDDALVRARRNISGER